MFKALILTCGLVLFPPSVPDLLASAAGGALTMEVVHTPPPTEGPFKGLSAFRSASDGWLYGTLSQGGAHGHGAIVRVNPASGAFEVWHSFQESDGVVGPPFFAVGPPRRHGVIEGEDGEFYALSTGYQTSIHRIDASGAGELIFRSIPVAEAVSVPNGVSPTVWIHADGSGETEAPQTGGYWTFYVHRGWERPTPYHLPTRGADGKLYAIVEWAEGEFSFARLERSGDFTILHSFPPADGVNATTTLVRGSDGAFYAAAAGVFRIDSTGAFQKLHDFREAQAIPHSLVASSDGQLYGLQRHATRGTIQAYSITPSGIMTILRENRTVAPTTPFVEGSDGHFYSVWTNFYFYGLTPFRVEKNRVFRLTRSGRLDVVHEFEQAFTRGGLTALELGSDGRLYGMAATGGWNRDVAVFRLSHHELPPQAMDDEVFGRHGESILIRVIENDIEPNGQRLTITAVTQPKQGEVSIGGDEIRYTPGPGFRRADVFTYSISDGHGGTSTAKVQVRNPFLAQSGNFFSRIIAPHGPTGTLRLSMTRNGNVTGTAKFERSTYIFRGSFDLDGALQVNLAPAVVLTLALDLSGEAAELSGTVTAGTTYEIAPAQALATSRPAELTSASYTMWLTRPAGESPSLGYGWAKIVVDRNGAMRLNGRLGDATAFAAGVPLQRDGAAYLRIRLNGSDLEFLSGRLSLAAAAPEEGSGAMTWVRRSLGSYLERLQLTANVAAFAEPADGARVLEFESRPPSVLIQFSQMIQGQMYRLRISAQDTGTLSLPFHARLILRTDRRTGVFRGSYMQPGASQPLPFNGVFDQARNRGYGRIGRDITAGAVEIVPQ